MKKYFVIGNPIDHSLSPKLHNYWLKENNIDAIYDKKKIDEKDLQNIILGFNPNLINYQLQIINNLKNEFKRNNFSQKIDNIDLTDPNKPKIKVFKP